MPYMKVKQGNKWCIYKKDTDGNKTGGTLGCHITEGKANDQLSALAINVEEIMNKTANTDSIVVTHETTPDKPDNAEMYQSWDMVDRANVPYGAKSFADVASAREAMELMERLEDTTAIFYSLFWEIWRDYDIAIPEKVSAWKTLFGDFSSAFESEIGAEETAMGELDEFSENYSGTIINVSESNKMDADARQPVSMDIVVIEPGWGNPKDKHYYPRDVLRRDANIFEGAKMYATDHRPEEKSVRTEVGKLVNIIGFTDTGAPTARVKIWNPDFAEDIRNRSKLGELGTLEVSILAKGKAKKGKIDGKDANIVESIIASKYTNVDFVTSAGAGGRALQLVENDKEVDMPDKDEMVVDEVVTDETPAENVQESEDVTLHENEEETENVETEQTEEVFETENVAEVEEDEPTFLVEADVTTILGDSKLPEISRNRLAKINYLTEADLQSAIQAEADYIKQLVRSGEPKNLGESSDVSSAKLSEVDLAEDHKKRVDAIIFG